MRPAPSRALPVAVTLGLLAASLVTDRIAKVLAEIWLTGREPLRFLADTVVLVLARNDGAFLGMGGGWPGPIKTLVLLVVPALVCVYGLWWCLARETNRLRLVGLVCLIGGGLGNLLDRAFLGFQVVDFLNFGLGPLRTGIVNVADLWVSAGAVVLVWQAMAARKTRRASELRGS